MCLGMIPKLLTDARETSYRIFSSLLTAECSTVELPGNVQRALVFILLQETESVMTFRPAAECSQQLSRWELLRFVMVGQRLGAVAW